MKRRTFGGTRAQCAFNVAVESVRGLGLRRGRLHPQPCIGSLWRLFDWRVFGYYVDDLVVHGVFDFGSVSPLGTLAIIDGAVAVSSVNGETGGGTTAADSISNEGFA